MAVQLTGYQGPRGFKAEQVYDKSGQMMQQAKQDAQYRNESFASYKEQIQRLGADIEKNQENDLRALSQFSNTLSDFLVDYQKKQNDKQYKLGIAEVMNGNVEFPESITSQHNADIAKLEAANNADNEIANQAIENGDPAFGVDFRQKSPAIKGWRAYGQAVGKARLAASQAQSFLTGFWERTEPIVRMPDGSFKSPQQIKLNGTREEIAAGNAIALAELSQKQGLYGINPVILGEEFAPTWQASSAATTSNILVGIGAARRKEAEVNTLNGLAFDVNQINFEQTSPETAAVQLGQSYQSAVQTLYNEGVYTKGQAADKAFKGQLEAIKLLPAPQAREAIKALRLVPKVATQPSMGTLGQFYKGDLDKALEDINSGEVNRQAQAVRAADLEAEQLIRNIDNARLNAGQGNAAQYIQATEADMARLRELGLTSEVASQFLKREQVQRATPQEFVKYSQAAEALDRDEGLTQDQIKAYGLPDWMEKTLLDRAADRAEQDFKSEQRQSIIDQAGKYAAGKNTGFTLRPDGKPSQSPQTFERFQRAVENDLWQWYEGWLKDNDGKPPSESQISTARNEIIIKQHPNFYDKNGNAIKYETSGGTPEGIAWSENVVGQRVYDVTGRADLAAITNRSEYLDPKRSIIITKSELEKEVENYLKPEYKPGARLAQWLGPKWTPEDVTKFLIDQSYHHGLPTTAILGSERSKAYREQRILAPTTSRYLYTGNDAQRSFALVNLGVIRAEEARIAEQVSGQRPAAPKELTPDGAGGTFQKEPRMLDVEIFAVAKAAGLNDKEARTLTAIALAESAGHANNRNFAYPDLSYGLWQINMLDEPGYKLGEDRRKKLGISSNEELYDPAVNARAMAMILRSQGLSAWSVYKNGSYRTFLRAAGEAMEQHYKSFR